MSGYLFYHRKIEQSDVWKKPHIYLKVWLLLLSQADYKTGKCKISLREIAKRVSWRENQQWRTPSNSTILTVLKWLEAENMIDRTLDRTLDREQSLITIVKYRDYQNIPHTSDRDLGATSDQPLTTPPLYMNAHQEVDLKEEVKDMHVPTSSADVNTITDHYHQHINPKSRATPNAKAKIKTRLETFSVTELLQAIDKFTADSWQMANNAHRGIAWFCHTDDRIDHYVNLVPRQEDPNGKSSATTCPNCRSDLQQKTYAAGNTRVPTQYHGVPILECNKCSYRRKEAVDV